MPPVIPPKINRSPMAKGNKLEKNDKTREMTG